jgi:hypothetical protein
MFSSVPPPHVLKKTLIFFVWQVEAFFLEQNLNKKKKKLPS